MGIIDFFRGKRKKTGHEFNDEDRTLAGTVRDFNRQIKIAELQNKLDSVESKPARKTGSLAEKIDEFEEVADLLGYSKEEPEQQNDFMQLMQLMQQQQGQPGAAPSPLPAPTPQPQPVIKVPPQIVEMFVDKLPEEVEQMVKAGSISHEYFMAISQKVWEHLNRT